MSTSSSNQSELQDHFKTDTCEHADCDAEFVVEHAIRGNYCSAECFYRHKGANVLDEIRRDHRLCATCFRQIKSVERPGGVSLKVEPPDHEGAAGGVRETIIGRQYPTEHTTWGLDVHQLDDYVILDRTRWSCECGTVDPSERDDIIEQVELDDNGIVGDLLETLHFLERSGAIDRRPSKQRLFEALREEWRDWEFAIGRCLYE